MSQHYDSGYKDVFSYPEIVRELLVQFADGEWLRQVDFTTLERVNASYVSEYGDQRHEDMVWKVKLAGEWMYVFVLLGFQSQPDRWMALRSLVYVGLLYQDLVKRGELSPEDKLPPVLPMVLYNGTSRWTAATQLQQLMLPPPNGLESWQPQHRYLLIEENAVDINALDPRSNLVVALFQLGRSRTPENVRRILSSFDSWLRAEEQFPLRRSIARWIVLKLRRRLSEASIVAVNDFVEVNSMSMLDETIERWSIELEHKGIQMGMVQGRLEGEAHLLSSLLEHRFGALPEWAARKLQDATESELVKWGRGIFDAPTLEQLFAR